MKTLNVMLAAVVLTRFAAAGCAILDTATAEQEEIITQIPKEQATSLVPQQVDRWVDANGWETKHRWEISNHTRRGGENAFLPTRPYPFGSWKEHVNRQPEIELNSPSIKTYNKPRFSSFVFYPRTGAS